MLLICIVIQCIFVWIDSNFFAEIRFKIYANGITSQPFLNKIQKQFCGFIECGFARVVGTNNDIDTTQMKQWEISESPEIRKADTVNYICCLIFTVDKDRYYLVPVWPVISGRRMIYTECTHLVTIFQRVVTIVNGIAIDKDFFALFPICVWKIGP